MQVFFQGGVAFDKVRNVCQDLHTAPDFAQPGISAKGFSTVIPK